jgi:hypothetical protein
MPAGGHMDDDVKAELAALRARVDDLSRQTRELRFKVRVLKLRQRFGEREGLYHIGRMFEEFLSNNSRFDELDTRVGKTDNYVKDHTKRLGKIERATREIEVNMKETKAHEWRTADALDKLCRHVIDHEPWPDDKDEKRH